MAAQASARECRRGLKRSNTTSAPAFTSQNAATLPPNLVVSIDAIAMTNVARNNLNGEAKIASGWRSDIPVAGAIAAYVAIPVLYLLGGALTDLSEGLGIGPQPGSIVGSFLAGYVIGYVFGIVGGFSMPGAPLPADGRPAS